MIDGEDGAPHGRAPDAGLPSGNRLLDALDAADAARLVPHVERLTLEAGHVLGETGMGLPWALFPCHHAVISLVALCDGHRTAEAATVGSEGVVGPGLTDLPDFGHLKVQMPGIAVRIGAEPLAEAAAGSEVLRGLLEAHQRALLAQALQTAVCAALHPVEARASYWLLMAQDRVGRPELPVTQEMLAEMLGVRRTTVTRVMAQLAERGLIRHRRSRVTVTDRDGLEAAACGCHADLLKRLRRITPALYPVLGGAGGQENRA